ncbi:hypothetical protein V3C99_008437 [Haemonchus contortus]
MSRTQRPGQTLQDNNAELQKAAATCEFEKMKDYRDAMVTMVFIGRLASMDTRNRLLERESLTSKEALEAVEAFGRLKRMRLILKRTAKRWAFPWHRLERRSCHRSQDKICRPRGSDHYQVRIVLRSRNILKGSNNR